MPQHHRVDIDDRTIRLFQRRREGLDQTQRTERAELDRVADMLETGAGQRFHRRHPECVVDQHIDLAEVCGDGLDERCDVVIIGDVRAHRQRVVSGVVELSGEILQAFDSSRRQHQLGAVARTPMRQRGAKARADAADHDYFFLEHSGHGYPNILAAICCWRNAIRVRQSSSEILLCSKCGNEAGSASRSTNSTVGPSASVSWRETRCQRNCRNPRRCPSVSTQLVTPGFWSATTMRTLPSGSAWACVLFSDVWW